MLLRDADVGLLPVVNLRADAERADQERALVHRRGLHDGETPRLSRSTDSDVGEEHVLPVAAALLQLDVLPVVRVEDVAGRRVVGDDRLGGRTTEGVALHFVVGLGVGLDVVVAQDALQFVVETRTVEDLAVLLQREAVEEFVVDGRLQLRDVVQHVAVRGLPVRDGAHRSLLAVELEVRLGLQAERRALALGVVGHRRRVAATGRVGALSEAEHAEVVDQVGRRGSDREEVADAHRAVRAGDHRVELDVAEAVLDGAVAGTGPHILLAVAGTRDVVQFDLVRRGHGRATGRDERLELVRLGEHLRDALAAVLHRTAADGGDSSRLAHGGVQPRLHLGAELLGLDGDADVLGLLHERADRGGVLLADLDVGTVHLDGGVHAEVDLLDAVLQGRLQFQNALLVHLGHVPLRVCVGPAVVDPTTFRSEP